MRPRKARLAALALCAAAAVRAPARAADLSGASVWLNVAAPLSTAALRGKVVALDFADDHAMDGRRSIKEMRALQARFPAGLAVIGVRAPLPGRAPESLESLRLDILRRDVTDPVIDDSSGAVAAAYGVTRQPVVVLLDAQGAEAGRFEGTGRLAELAAAARRLLEEARARGALDPALLPLSLERDSLREGPLLFPTQLLYDAGRGRLFVADTGHHRIVALTASGRAKQTIGTGVPLFFDGPADEAGFDRPEGLAVAGSDLFVGDTDDGVVRRVYLDKRFVITYASGSALRAPRGLAVSSGTLYIAEAAEHAVDAADLSTGHFYRFAGTGKPGRADGLLAVAQLEEPAALAVLGATLWIADAGAGALRALPLDAPELRTPVLSGPAAPLVRPAALAALGDRLLVADAGDGRLKLVDPRSGQVTVFAEGLLQPSGVAVVGDEVVACDTGRSRLLRFSREGSALGELRVKGLKSPPPGPPLADLPPRDELEPDPQPVRSGVEDRLALDFQLPQGYHLNPRAPVVYHVSETRGHLRLVERTRKGVVFAPRRPIEVLFTAQAERTEIILNVDFYYCRADDKGPCLAGSKRYRVILLASPSQRQRRASVTIKP